MKRRLVSPFSLSFLDIMFCGFGAVVLLVLVLPLFAPLRGMLHRRRYTIAWSCFLALIYFTHGVVEAYVSESTRHLGLLEVVFSSLWFLAAMAYVRVTAARS